jgi:hypothetical protein
MAKRRSVPFPENFDRPEALADWLELSALHAADQDASMGDAQRELDRLNCRNQESLLGKVLTEFDRRVQATGSAAYPFERGDSSIRLKGTARSYPAYFFCLALSYYGWKIRKGAPENPWLLFEELSLFSAKNYLGGNAMLFGTSARKGSKAANNAFRSNIEALIKALGEGQCFTSPKTFSSKDSKLDIVAWKGFADKRSSQVIVFGQCKSGKNWTDGLSELEPDAFWDQWLAGGKGKVSQLLRSVFVPHRLFDEEEWDHRARWARLLFDRCRVVSHSHSSTASGSFAVRLLACCRTEWKLPL